MPCPSCSSSDVVHDDDVLACQSCGAVLEDAFFQDNNFTSASNNIEYFVKTKKAQTGKHKSAKECVNKIAAYFHIPEDLATKAKQLIQQHSTKLSNRHSMELALLVVYLVARDWLSAWSVDDFIENFPVPVDRFEVQRIQFIFARESVIYKDIQCKTSHQELQRFLVTIIPHLRNQFDGSPKISKTTLIRLKHRTEALIKMGDQYLLNTGRKLRPTVIVAAIISYASILISNPKFKYSGKMSIYLGRRLEVFRKCCAFGPRILRMRLQEYTDFLLVCAQNIPWIKDPKAEHVHYYLSDILDLYAKKEGEEEPSLKLTDDQYSISLLKRGAELAKEYEVMFQNAQQHLDNGTEPENHASLGYCIYNLMKMGYEKEHLIAWSEKTIRGMSDSLNYRAKYGRTLNTKLDLDRKELDDNDMLDSEVDLYIK
ncbi:phosphatidylinositol synthase 1 (CDP-alcohol phosphatidyltransferase1) [Mucor velutinosus]|uniref:Phosphatidylinositol synthase 1 (CDP-alcohol phosphatidyltransferase1) n=1 Tax=Mucor velutinosus TaxID=708070 RepID=A0AAN7DSE9_9FUNG|nr:phosphatidylinositol synthase 1 (CDP-alcohol phosphatidyltransferase1) [Mucor velutinosus]